MEKFHIFTYTGCLPHIFLFIAFIFTHTYIWVNNQQYIHYVVTDRTSRHRCQLHMLHKAFNERTWSYVEFFRAVLRWIGFDWQGSESSTLLTNRCAVLQLGQVSGSNIIKIKTTRSHPHTEGLATMLTNVLVLRLLITESVHPTWFKVLIDFYWCSVFSTDENSLYGGYKYMFWH